MKRCLYLIIMCLALGVAQLRSQEADQLYLAYTDSASRCMDREEWIRAEGFLTSALRLRPSHWSNALLLSNLGVVRTQLERYPEALEAFEVGLSLSPRSTVLLTNRAKTLMAMGRWSDAMADLSAALAVDGSLYWPRKMRGMLLAANPDKAAEAEADLRKCHEAMPKDIDVTLALGEMCLDEGKPAEALEWTRQSYELQPQDAETVFWHARMLMENELFSDASQAISEGIKANPLDGNLFLLRARLRYLMHQISDAESDKKIAIENGADPQLVQSFFPERVR